LFWQKQIDRCDCLGSDGYLDTKIYQIDLCHIFMSYASYDIKCHIMTYDAYDIEIWHKSIWPTVWTSAITPINLMLAKKYVKNVSEIFPFINFENILYFRSTLLSIFTYQKGLGSKMMFSEMFLKLNFTSKYIWGKIRYCFQ
jgi:hypothetical protein